MGPWLRRLLGRPTAGEDERAPAGDPLRVAEVESVLEELRPLFRADGGDIRLVGVRDGWVEVELRGACGGCRASPLTLHGALEPRLRERYPWVRGVRAV